jgi:hypothetical protein
VEQWKKGGKEKRYKGLRKEITVEVGKRASVVDNHVCDQGQKSFPSQGGCRSEGGRVVRRGGDYRGVFFGRGLV